jgi:hypothetical protein
MNNNVLIVCCCREYGYDVLCNASVDVNSYYINQVFKKYCD